MSDTLKIMAEPQMNPNECRFTLEKPLYETGGSYRFSSKSEAESSLLAKKLFAVDYVVQVFIAPTTILVTKAGPDDWRILGPKIGSAIRDAVASGQPLVDESLAESFPSEDEIRLKVQKILDEQINPSVAMHGGFIELLDVKKNDIFVRMGGGCQGCASSTVTLKQGVEESLRRDIPELGMIYDTTDHAAGMNPYFSG